MKSRNIHRFAPRIKIVSGRDSVPMKRRKTALLKPMTNMISVACAIFALILPILVFSNIAFSEPDIAPPVQSAWSPANGATLKNSVLTLRFSTDEAADCRWSLADHAYSEMTGDCSGDGTTSQRCDMASLEEGSEIVYTACRDSLGNEDSAETNEHIDYSIILPAGDPSPAPGLNITLAGSLAGGSPRNVFVRGNYAYVAANAMLSILDISNPAAPSQAGYIGTPSYSSDVVVSGNYAYVTDRFAGLRVINVSDPSAPALVGYHNMTDTLTGISVSGNYAYVADGNKGMRVIDISNPAAPSEVGFYDTPGFAVGVYVSGKYAYVADDNQGLRVIDISNPAAPSEVGFIVTHSAQDVYVAGNYAYVADYSAGLRVIDVTNPSSPTEIGFNDFSGSAYGVHVLGNYAYVADLNNGLRIIDVTNPAAPSETGFLSLPQDSNNGVFVMNNYAYVANTNFGLRVIDVTNPSAPSESGFYDTPNSAEKGVYISGEYAYVAAYDTLKVIDVSTPSAPIVKNFLTMPDKIENVNISGNLAYLANGNYGFSVIDISNPVAPSVVGLYDTPGYAVDVYVAGMYAYVADGNSGLRVIDISNPAAPSEVGFYDTPDNAQGVFVSGNYAYVADFSSGLLAIDISNPAAPTKVGYIEGWYAVDVYVSGKHAYVGASYTGLRVIDISNPMALVEVGSLDIPDMGWWSINVAVSGNYAYVAGDHSDLRLVDISNPTMPLGIGYYKAPGAAIGVFIAGNYVYTSFGGAGLYIFENTLGDTTTPNVADNQAGDDAWRTEDPRAVYDVDFYDDGGAGLNNVQYSVWSAAGMSAGTGTQIIGWTDIADNINAASYTDNWGVAFASLSEGTNYVSVRAYDNSGNESAVATDVFYIRKETSIPSSVSYVRDGTGEDVDTTESTTTLSANWSESTDAQSGVAAYWYAVGTSAGATNVVDWTGVGTATGVTLSDLTLASGTTYFFSVKAENGVGLFSGVSTSDGILCSPPPPADTTPPTAVSYVNDGSGADIDETTSTSQLSANWSASSDSESGIARYWYSIGTAPGATDVVAWTDSMLNTSVARTGLSLENGRKYYFSVRAENSAGLMSNTMSSDGLIVVINSISTETPGKWGMVGTCKKETTFNYAEVFGTATVQIVSFQNGTFTYLPVSGNITLERGKGYFIISPDSPQIVLPGSGNEELGDTYSFTLDSGWNLFTNPFCHPLAWGKMNASLVCNGAPQGDLKHKIYRYNGDSGYTPIELDKDYFILPWSAYWIKAPEIGCVLTLSDKK